MTGRHKLISYILFFFIVVASVLFTKPIFAQVRVTVPSFPACSQPQGSVKVSYTDGVHGIPGDTNTYTGSDTVYYLTDQTLTQCFCDKDDEGIQTNWWKISSLSFDEIEYLKKLGWIYIPTGSDWGLEDAPYMAYNKAFDCDKGDDKKEDNDDDDENDNEPRLGGVMTSVTGEILGLASTGDAPAIFGFLASGVLFTLTGLLSLRKK